MDRAQRFFGMYVDGGYRPAQSGNVFAVENPKDRSVVAEVAEGAAVDIDAAVAAARNALPGWSSLSGAQRGDLMHRAADALARRLAELVDVEIDQTGRPRCEMAAAGSCPGPWAARAAAVSGRIKPRQAGSSERNVNTSTSPWPESTRSHETRPYLWVRN